MLDLDLANEIIKRFNQLIENPIIRADIEELINHRIRASSETYNHPTIQTAEDSFGLLGVLNGLVGAIPEGPKKGWGYIAAEFNDEGDLVRFVLSTTPVEPQNPLVEPIWPPGV